MRVCDPVEMELIENRIGYISVLNKSKLLIKADGFDYIVNIPDVVEYYATQANNIMSNCRQLGNIVGDWRPIDGLAETCIEVVKRLNIQKLRQVGKQYGLEPKF